MFDNAEKARQQRLVSAQAEQLKRLIEQQQSSIQSRLQNLSQPNVEVITKLMQQIEKSGVMNNASPAEINKIIQILTQQMISAGVQQPQELADLLRMMMTNMQQEKKRKEQEQQQSQAALL